jgi:Transglutaminase-like superfamily/TgpA N-terminal domain
VRELYRRFLQPREGWLSLALLCVMLMSVAWSVQRAAWFEQLDFLVPVALCAAIAGALLGITRWSVVAALPFSGLLGAGVVLWTVGAEYFTGLSQAGRLMALRGDAIGWTRVVLDRGYPAQVSPYAIGFGVLMWVTAFMAAYAIYRHHRVIDAILLVGAVLIANMSATFADLFGYIILFSAAALLLWLRIALISREESWHLRRVTENADVHGSMMRSGVTFIAASLALAWILTTVAVAAPLTGVLTNLNGVWSNLRDSVGGVFGGISNPDSRIPGTSFGSSFAVGGRWVSSDTAVMTVASKRPYYLRTITYDVYTGHGWSRSNGPKRGVAPGDRIFPGYTPERPLSADAFALETVTVEIQQNLGNNIFTPGFPTAAFLPVVVQQPDGQPFLGGLESGVGLQPGKGYQITAAISNATEAMLAGAGADYPREVSALYLDTTGVTDRTKERARALVAGIPDPYHQAAALAAYLQGPRFRYSTIAPLPSDPSRDLVDFFLFDPKGQIGYCEYFATAMAMMARSVGLPARVAVGYAPGERVTTGVYQYRERNAHAWAEIYFPGYGWQIFEATKSLPPVVRLAGSGVVPPVVPPVGGGGTSPFDEGVDPGVVSHLPNFDPVSGGFLPGQKPPVDDARSGNLLLLTGVLGLVAAVLAWRLVRLRRRFRFLAPGDRQWQRLALAGDRAGAARNPSETIYEYAGWLEEQLPAQRGEIRQIADGKVWQSYSGRSISAEAIARLERAWARLQLPLVWLTIKRRLAAFVPGRGRA